MGAHVVLPVRNKAKAEYHVAEMKRAALLARGSEEDEEGKLQEYEDDDKGEKVKILKGDLTIIECDLSSLASVQKFVDEFGAEFDELHYLINNAGMYGASHSETDDALQATMQVNHLSHFYLTNLLLPKLRNGGSQAEPARVVTVSSTAHYYGTLNWDDIEAGRVQQPSAYGVGWNAYANSKLLNVVFANELQRRIDTQPLLKGLITSTSLHPGTIATGLSREANFVARLFVNGVLGLIGKSTKQGAQTTLCATLSSELNKKGAVYLDDCEIVAPHPEAVYKVH